VAFINNKGHGHDDVAAAVTYQADTVTITDDVNLFRSRDLGNRGMPRVSVYLQQTLGAVPCVASIEFSVSDSTNKSKVWFPAGSGTTTPLNVPLLIPLQIPAKFVRVTFLRPVGQVSTVRVALMAAQ
jgi:hypothetical protein